VVEVDYFLEVGGFEVDVVEGWVDHWSVFVFVGVEVMDRFMCRLLSSLFSCVSDVVCVVEVDG